MTESASAPSLESNYASPEAYLAEVDSFVRKVQIPSQTQSDDAQRLQAFLAEAEAYLQAGRFDVAAAAYERLLVIIRQFEAAARPVEAETAVFERKSESDSLATTRAEQPAKVPEPETGPEGSFSEPAYRAAPNRAATGQRRTVHVERKKIRPYRLPEAGASTPQVDEIQRAPAPAGYRPLAAIPATPRRPAASPGWLPILVATIIIGVAAVGGLVYRDTLMSVIGLGQAQPPTGVAIIGRTATLATPAPTGRTPSAIKLPTNIVTTHVAPTNTLTATLSAGSSPTAPATTATPTAIPSVTQTPTVTPTPTPTATPTATSTATPLSTPVLVFAGPNPLAGTAGILYYETFEPTAYYWRIGETGFSLSRVKDGLLEVTLKRPYDVAWLFADVPAVQDSFAMVTAVSPNCDGGDHIGLNFRVIDDGAQFQFGVTCDGRYRLLERNNGAVILRVSPTASDVIKRGPGAVNELGVRAEGKQLSLYVNRQFLTRVDTETVTKGRFGVYVSAAATSGLTAQFDNFIAWGMKAP